MDYKGIEYSVVKDKPGFFPLKRAHHALQCYQGDAMSITQFVDYVAEAQPVFFRDIEYISFYDFTYNTEGKYRGTRFRVAQLYLAPDPYVRDGFFEAGPEITASTGWYPLAMGSRARFTHRKYAKAIRFQATEVDIGDVISVANASSHDGGQSVLLQGDKGSILLDTGFGVAPEAIGLAEAVFVSHYHKDHVAGLGDFRCTRVPLIVPEPVLASIWGRPDTNLQGLSRRFHLAEDCTKTSKKFYTFPVFHAPGSHGCVYTDGARKAVIYPGDLCLRNRFADRRGEVLDFVRGVEADQKWVLVDAALVGNKDSLLNQDASLDQWLDEFSQSTSDHDLAFVADSPELLVYTYLYTFFRTRVSKHRLVVNGFTHGLLRSLWGYVMTKSEHRDSVIYSTVGGTKSDFVETFRLYRVSSLIHFRLDEKVIMFLSSDDLENPIVRDRLSLANVVLLGKYALDEEAFTQHTDALSSPPLRVASPDWSFHSSEEDVRWLVESLSAEGVRTILFHNYPKRLAKFVRKYGLNSDMVKILRRGELPIC